MSINVEMIGGSFVVQHYVEDIAEKHHIRLISLSDTFSPNGHTKVQVIWELSVKPIDGRSCEFTNHVHGDATEEFHVFLDKQGLSFESAKQARQQASEAHNRIETSIRDQGLEMPPLTSGNHVIHTSSGTRA